MKIFRVMRDLFRDEFGAVTVDWVALSAAVVILTIGAIATLDFPLHNLVGQIATVVKNVL